MLSVVYALCGVCSMLLAVCSTLSALIQVAVLLLFAHALAYFIDTATDEEKVGFYNLDPQVTLLRV
jgi:hypothetical protein